MASLMIIFMYQLVWAIGVQTLVTVLGGSVRVFLDLINICTSTMGKADCSPQCGWAFPHPLKTSIEQKASAGENCSRLNAYIRTLAFSGLSTWMETPALLMPQLGDFGMEITPSVSGIAGPWIRNGATHHLSPISSFPNVDLGFFSLQNHIS